MLRLITAREQLELLSPWGIRLGMPTYYHVTPWQNRDSILQHGIDYTKGEHQWGETPGNYFWENKHDANEYAEDLTQMRLDDGGWDDPDDASFIVMPFRHTGPVLDDLEGNHELARGKSFYTTDPIPATAFQKHKRAMKSIQPNMKVPRQVNKFNQRAEEARVQGNTALADYLDFLREKMLQGVKEGQPQPFSQFYPLAEEEFDL